MSVETEMSDAELLFSTFQNKPACSNIQELNYSDRCQFANTDDDCLDQQYYFNYVQFLYCVLQPYNSFTLGLGVLVLLSLCIVMFIILGTTADKVFCPALQVLSNEFGMNEHLAGVTVLAFGNGSPDLFTSLAAINQPSKMMFSDLYGAAIYVHGVVGALICIISPFHLPGNSTVRDYGFLMLSALYIDHCIITDDAVTVWEGFCIIMIYVVYLIIIIADQLLLKRYLKFMERKAATYKVLRANKYQEIQDLRSEANIEILARSRVTRFSVAGQNRVTINIEKTRLSSFNEVGGPNDNLMPQLWESLNPIDKLDWQESGIAGKAFILFKAPIELAISIIIPIVDYEMDRHSWSKLLNCIQLVTMPLIIIAAVKVGHELQGMEIELASMVVTVPLAVFTFYKTRTDYPPRFHSFFGIYSALGAMFFIYTCASETVNIMVVLGLITGCSNAFLGATMLAWGNSIGDMVANMSLASSGYQKMGYAACIGGPFFNSVLSMGLTYMIKAMQSPLGKTKVIRGALGENCLVFLLLLLCTNLFALLAINFYTRRSSGLFSVAVYCLFILFVVLGEWELIHTYAGDSTGGLS